MKNQLLSAAFLLTFTGLSAQQHPAILINEFLASNVSTNADIVDFDDFSDWIELYNAEEVEADIGGFALSDNPGNPHKWTFPPGASIPPKGFLLVWADGYNDFPGRIRQRPYAPFDNFTTRYYHLNFKLNRAGEFIGLFSQGGILVDSVTFHP